MMRAAKRRLGETMGPLLRLVWLPMVVLSFAAAALAGTVDDAAGHVRRLGDKAITALSNSKSMTETERDAEFRRLMKEGFDLQLIGRFVMGVHWRRATDDEKAEYTRLFEDYVIKTYASRLNSYNDERFEVQSGKPDDEKDVIVASLIHRSDGAPVRVDWRVRIAGEQPKVIDVIVEGASMAISQRSEFSSIIQNNGGQIAALIKLLREKTGK